MKTLLEKLEKIRKELGADKVFDVIGKLFEGVSIRDYMEQAISGDAAAVERRIEGTLTKEQVTAWQATQETLFGKDGDGGAVKRELPRLKETMEQETYRRLLPGYVGRFLEKSAPLVDIGIEGDLQGCFAFRPLGPGRLDWLLPSLERYAAEARETCTLYHPNGEEQVVFLHPGEPVFDRFRSYVCDRFAEDAQRGAIFIDPTVQRPYFFHLVQVAVVRVADPMYRSFKRGETLESRLIGLKQWQDGSIEECSPEQLLLLRGSTDLPPSMVSFAASADTASALAAVFAREQVVESIVRERRQALQNDMPLRKEFIERSFIYQAADLAELRKKQKEKADQGIYAQKAKLYQGSSSVKKNWLNAKKRRWQSSSVKRSWLFQER